MGLGDFTDFDFRVVAFEDEALEDIVGGTIGRLVRQLYFACALSSRFWNKSWYLERSGLQTQ